MIRSFWSSSERGFGNDFQTIPMSVSSSGKKHRITSMSKGIETVRADSERLATQATKKADVAEHPKAFDHVGLLFNEPPGRAGLFFI